MWICKGSGRDPDAGHYACTFTNLNANSSADSYSRVGADAESSAHADTNCDRCTDGNAGAYANTGTGAG